MIIAGASSTTVNGASMGTSIIIGAASTTGASICASTKGASITGASSTTVNGASMGTSIIGAASTTGALQRSFYLCFN